MENKLTVSLSPHLHSRNSISRSMWNVIIALIPALAVAIWTFGVDALWVIAVSVCACMLTEWLIERFMFHRPCTLMNGSAIITGLLLAFNLPSILPWWMVVVGAVVAIGIGKMSFGGLGCNIWNPALVGRVFLLISFPVAMTTWPLPIGRFATADGTTGATILSQLKTGIANSCALDLPAMFADDMGGSIGEVSTGALLLGFVYLLVLKIIKWHIPVSIVAGLVLVDLMAPRFAFMRGIHGHLLCDLSHDKPRHASLRPDDWHYHRRHTPVGLISRRNIICHIDNERSHASHQPIYAQHTLFRAKKGGHGMKSSLRNMILSLTGLTVAIGAALAVVNEATADAIKETARRSRIEAMEAILPNFDNDIIATQELSEGLPLYRASFGGEPVGIAIETYSDNGFSGHISIIAGFDNNGKITGYRVLGHQETPGLGAKMGEWFATEPHSVIG